MARGNDVRYIRYYTDGSAARKVEPKLPKTFQKKVPKPRRRQQKMIQIRLDPLAMGSVVIAVVLAVMMVSGAVNCYHQYQEQIYLESYVSQLQTKYGSLESTYRESYDLDKIREEAAVYGMVPISQVETHEIKVASVAEEPEPTTFWDWITALFQELFA